MYSHDILARARFTPGEECERHGERGCANGADIRDKYRKLECGNVQYVVCILYKNVFSCFGLQILCAKHCQ